MSQQKLSHHFPQMPRRIFSFSYRVRSIGINHQAELFVVGDQFVYQHLRRLVVTIVIAGSVDKQQIAFQVFGKVDR